MKSVSNRASMSLIAGTACLFYAVTPAFAGLAPHAAVPSLAPAVSTGSCLATATAYSVSTDIQKSSSRRYRDVTGTSLSFTQSTPGCVEVSFSAEAATVPNEILIAQAVLDGSTPCLPGDNLFASDSPSGDLADHAMTYICPGVTAGNHTVNVQFKSRFGGQVVLDYRTTIVRYAK